MSLKLIAALALAIAPLCAQTVPVELSVNSGFETGDFTGWQEFPSTPGNIQIVTPGNASNFAACIDNQVIASASLIKNANVGIGIVQPGETVTISFDARGATAIGGVAFAEFFSELSGGGISAGGILGGAPLALNPDPSVWTRFSFTATTGPDVSGGVTLQLAAITGAAPGSTAFICFDNISITVDRLAATSTVVGSGCGGGAMAPTLSISPPVLGQTLSFSVANGQPSTAGFLYFSAPVGSAIALGSGCFAALDLGSFAEFLPIATDINGDWNLSLPLPANPLAAGFSLSFQALLFPTSGPLGVDLTNGVEVTLGF